MGPEYQGGRGAAITQASPFSTPAESGRADVQGMKRNPAPTFPGVAVVLGFQEDGAGGGFWLFNLVRDIPGHPAGSTVSEKTLNKFRECQAAGMVAVESVRNVRSF